MKRIRIRTEDESDSKKKIKLGEADADVEWQFQGTAEWKCSYCGNKYNVGTYVIERDLYKDRQREAFREMYTERDRQVKAEIQR